MGDQPVKTCLSLHSKEKEKTSTVLLFAYLKVMWCGSWAMQAPARHNTSLLTPTGGRGWVPGVSAHAVQEPTQPHWRSSALKLDKSTLFPHSFDKTACEMRAAKHLLGWRAKRSRWLLARAGGRYRDPSIGPGIAPSSPLTTVQGVGCLLVLF